MKFDIQKARKEFSMLIERCGCSRAGLTITEKDVEEAKKAGIDLQVKEPSCTPKRCYPALYKLLYPKGGFYVVSQLIKKKKKRRRQ